MKIGVKVGDLMTSNFVSISSGATLREATKKMVGKRVGTLAVLKEKELQGVISERDILWVITKGRNLEEVKVYDVMSKNVVTIEPEKDIYDALLLMKKKKRKVLPVVNKVKEGRRTIYQAIGVLTIKDILRIQPTLFDIACQLMPIKEERRKRKKIKKITKEGGWVKKGKCEKCGKEDFLYEANGILLCEECKNQ